MIQGLPERLRDLRKSISFSQRDVAKHLHVSPSIISGYETGERTPSVENAVALAALYRCSMDELLLGKRSYSPNEYISTDGLSKKQIHLIVELIGTIRVQN